MVGIAAVAGMAADGAITGAGLPPVQSSEGCSLRPTITGRHLVTITGLRREMR